MTMNDTDIINQMYHEPHNRALRATNAFLYDLDAAIKARFITPEQADVFYNKHLQIMSELTQELSDSIPEVKEFEQRFLKNNG